MTNEHHSTNKQLSPWYKNIVTANFKTERVVLVTNTGNQSFEDCYGGIIHPGKEGYQISSVIKRYPHLVPTSKLVIVPEAPVSHSETPKDLTATTLAPSTTESLVDPLQRLQ